MRRSTELALAFASVIALLVAWVRYSSPSSRLDRVTRAMLAVDNPNIFEE